jgi:hypothetical protein
MNANWFAYAALLSWPLIAVVMYKTQPVPKATIFTILGALLLLPSEASLKLEMIPAFDKNSIPILCALIGCVLLTKRKGVRYGFGLVEIVAATYIISPLFTSAQNNDAIFVGRDILPGVGIYDGISSMLGQSVIVLPFFIGRHFLRKSNDTEEIMRILVAAGLLYSLPMLFEVRMSPQLSNWVYGFFPSSFITEARYGGFRPVVFMINGLALSFFAMTALLASIALWRMRIPLGKLPPAVILAYLAFVLVLCKSLGVLVYASIFGPLVGWAKSKLIVRIATLLVGIGLLYPLLRIEQVFPDKLLVALVRDFNEDRANSLETRFEQEKQLLDRSSQRPVFGWGRYGRSRVYDEYGKDISLTDGLWIITVGQFGIVGFLAQFCLLGLPVFRAAASVKFAETVRDKLLLATLSLMVALSLIEQLPNSSLSPWNWLLAGSLLGRAEWLRLTLQKRAMLRGSFSDPKIKAASGGDSCIQ